MKNKYNEAIKRINMKRMFFQLSHEKTVTDYEIEYHGCIDGAIDKCRHIVNSLIKRRDV